MTLERRDIARMFLLPLVGLLVSGCRPPEKTPPTPTKSSWAFHALNGVVGEGPMLGIDGEVFWLRGCGAVMGFVQPMAGRDTLQISEASPCGAQEQTLQTELLTLLDASPSLILTQSPACGGRQIELRSPGRSVIFCEIARPE